jgi:hypothetical protein
MDPEDLNPAPDDPRRLSYPEPHWNHQLNQQELSFARAYAASLDLHKAWTTAGFAPHTTKTKTMAAATRLLATPAVQERMVWFRQLAAAKMDLTDERLLNEVAAIALLDPLDFFDPDTQAIRPMHEIPSHARAAIAQFDVDVTEDAAADGTITTRTHTKVKFWNKLNALDLATKIKGLQNTAAASSPVVVLNVKSPQPDTVIIDQQRVAVTVDPEEEFDF